MSNPDGGGEKKGLSKAELRKQAKAAKKEAKEKKVAKALDRQENEPSVAKEPKNSPRPQQQKKSVVKAASSSSASQPKAMGASSPPARQPASPKPVAATPEPVRPMVTMFMSDFPKDWTSGAVPLLAALRRLITAVISHQDDHDCSLEAASLKTRHSFSDGTDELLRHFDETHLRPFFAAKLGLTPPSESGHASGPVLRKTLLQVGHLAVVKWVRELLLTLRIEARARSKGGNSEASQKSGLGHRGTELPPQLFCDTCEGVIDLLSSLSESLLDLYIEHIQLAADGICRFASEILLSSTTSRSISPAFPVDSVVSAMSAFPPSLIVTLASCQCNTNNGQDSALRNSKQATLSHLVSRTLTLMAKNCDQQRQLAYDLGDEGDTDGENGTTSHNRFQPPCLTVAVATPGCCHTSYSSLFDRGDLGRSQSLVVFAVPLSRLGSAIADHGQVSALVLPADAVLANRGSAVLAPRGAGLLALAARAQWHCPVIVLAETYKIIAGGQDEIEETVKGLAVPKSGTGKVITELYTEDADVISADSISVVVTELGSVPAAALPSILRLSQKTKSRGNKGGSTGGLPGHQKESEQIDLSDLKPLP